VPRTGLSAEEIKDRAVEYAEEAIRTFGFERFRLIEVARELNVSHVALYKHFSDKAALLDSVTEKWLARVDASLERACAVPGRTPTERLHDLFLTLHRAKRDKVSVDPELYKAFDVAAEASKPFVVRHLATVERLLEGIIRDAIAAGEIRSGDVRRIGRLLHQATVAFHHPKLVAQHLGEKREAELRRLLDTLLRGLAHEA
jgi:AcrR family transcriptional regulator